MKDCGPFGPMWEATQQPTRSASRVPVEPETETTLEAIVTGQRAIQNYLDALAELRLNVEVTSRLRSPKDNARVGGDARSQHLIGWAVDLVGRDLGTAASVADQLGLVPIHEGSHLHVQVALAGTVPDEFFA